MIAYLDTSVAVRALTTNDLTEPTGRYLDESVKRGDLIVSSSLLRTELLCQANRQAELDPGEIEQLLRRVNLAETMKSDLDDAPTAPGRLRTLDAIHLTVALRVGADLMLAYDDELRRASQLAGLRVGP